jgi:hypothetical protein
MADPTWAEKKTVLAFGDSWAAWGPSWRAVQDTLNEHRFPATVISTAKAGHRACKIIETEGPKAMVNAARSAFPDARDGPDYVWYTLGANDIAHEGTTGGPLAKCALTAFSFDAITRCAQECAERTLKCTATLLDNYFEAFPKSNVMQSGYDLPCEGLANGCMFVADAYVGHWCGLHQPLSHTCLNKLFVAWHGFYVGGLIQKYAQSRPQYTGINVLGTVQKAAGIGGAEVGHPVLDKGSPCQWEVVCEHPTYGRKGAKAIGDAFWEKYFLSEQIRTGHVGKVSIFV